MHFLSCRSTPGRPHSLTLFSSSVANRLVCDIFDTHNVHIQTIPAANCEELPWYLANFLVVWSRWCFFAVFGATYSADRGAVIAAEPQVRGDQFPRFTTMIRHSWMDAGHANLAAYLRREVPGGENRQGFLELSQAMRHLTAMAPLQLHLSTSCYPGGRKWPPHQVWIHLHSSHWSVVDWPSSIGLLGQT